LDTLFRNKVYSVLESYRCCVYGVFNPSNIDLKAGVKRNPNDLLGSPSVSPTRVIFKANRKRKLNGSYDI